MNYYVYHIEQNYTFHLTQRGLLFLCLRSSNNTIESEFLLTLKLKE